MSHSRICTAQLDEAVVAHKQAVGCGKQKQALRHKASQAECRTGELVIESMQAARQQQQRWGDVRAPSCPCSHSRTEHPPAGQHEYVTVDHPCWPRPLHQQTQSDVHRTHLALCTRQAHKFVSEARGCHTCVIAQQATASRCPVRHICNGQCDASLLLRS